MKVKLISKITVQLLLSGVCACAGAVTAWAQAPAEPATQAPADDGIAVVPEEGTRSNLLITGVRVAGSWDDNALNSAASNKLQDELISVEPHLALHLARPRTKASFDYTPGFTFSQEVSQYNARSQTLSGTAEHRLTRRLTLNEYNTFSLSTSAYDQFRASNLNGDVPITERPNDSAVVPGTRRTSAGTASLSRSAITGGSFSWSAAATLNLQFARNSIEFSGARQVSDGGGLSSVVRLSRASVDASRNLGKSWTARVGGNYNLNDVLAGPLPLGQFRFWMANGSIVRSITRSA